MNNNKWYRYILNEQEQKNSGVDSQGNLPKSNQDNFGSYIQIPVDEEIKKQILDLEKKPNGSFVLFSPEKYLRGMYPEDLFPGGWKQVFDDAYKARVKSGKNVNIWKFHSKIIIVKNNNIGRIFGYYNPPDGKIYMNFKSMREFGVDPFAVIIHEIGHLFNAGEKAVNSELEALSQEYIKNYKKRAEESGQDIQPIEAQGISNFGKIMLANLKNENPELYEKIRTHKSGNQSFLAYIFSESESYPRYYQPIKFWFARLLQRVKTENPSININLGSEEDYPKLLNYANSQEYENLANAIKVANASSGPGTIFIANSILDCDPKINPNTASKCILRRPEIYNDIISTVKGKTQKQYTA